MDSDTNPMQEQPNFDLEQHALPAKQNAGSGQPVPIGDEPAVPRQRELVSYENRQPDLRAKELGGCGRSMVVDVLSVGAILVTGCYLAQFLLSSQSVTTPIVVLSLGFVISLCVGYLLWATPFRFTSGILLFAGTLASLVLAPLLTYWPRVESISNMRLIELPFCAATALFLGRFLRTGGLRIPGGILLLSGTLMALGVPLLLINTFVPYPASTYGLEYRTSFETRSTTVYLAAIAVLAVVIWLVRFPPLVALAGLPLLEMMFSGGWSPGLTVAIVGMGVGLLGLGFWLESRTEQDYSLWLYLSGHLHVLFAAVSAMSIGGIVPLVVYLLVSIAFVVTSVWLQRRIFLLFGAIGVYTTAGALVLNGMIALGGANSVPEWTALVLLLPIYGYFRWGGPWLNTHVGRRGRAARHAKTLPVDLSDQTTTTPAFESGRIVRGERLMRIQRWSAQSEQKVEELAHGQVVIVAARWLLVLLALLLMLWDPEPLATLRIQILFVLLMAVANFYLHAQVLTRRPILPKVTYAASAADLVVITILLIVNGGFQSSSYTFYFPALVAFSVVFPTEITTLYVLGMTGAYTTLSLATMSGTGDEYQVLVARLIIFVAVAVCGNVYWRIERSRRQNAFGIHNDGVVDESPFTDFELEHVEPTVPVGERS